MPTPEAQRNVMKAVKFESLVVRCPIGHAQYFIMLRLKRLTKKQAMDIKL